MAKQVPKKDFIKAVVENDTLEDAGIALADVREGEPLKPNSVYNRYNKLRNAGITLPDRPIHSSNDMSTDEANEFIASLLGSDEDEAETAEGETVEA